MNRRRMLTLPAWLLATGAASSGFFSAHAAGQPGYTVSTGQLEQAAAQRFPHGIAAPCWQRSGTKA